MIIESPDPGGSAGRPAVRLIMSLAADSAAAPAGRRRTGPGHRVHVFDLIQNITNFMIDSSNSQRARDHCDHPESDRSGTPPRSWD